MSEEQGQQSDQNGTTDAPGGDRSTQESGSEFTPITSQEEFDKALSKRLDRERAKFADYDELKGKVKESDRQRKAAMSDTEKALSEAESRGRTAAASDYGKRLARTEFDNLAGRRNPDFDTASALEFVDLSKFIDEAGEPDVKAIAAAVERLVPTAAGGAPSYDGGARSSTKPQDFNQELRRAAGRA